MGQILTGHFIDARVSLGSTAGPTEGLGMWVVRGETSENHRGSSLRISWPGAASREKRQTGLVVASSSGPFSARQCALQFLGVVSFSSHNKSTRLGNPPFEAEGVESQG